MDNYVPMFTQSSLYLTKWWPQRNNSFSSRNFIATLPLTTNTTAVTIARAPLLPSGAKMSACTFTYIKVPPIPI